MNEYIILKINSKARQKTERIKETRESNRALSRESG